MNTIQVNFDLRNQGDQEIRNSQKASILSYGSDIKLPIIHNKKYLLQHK